MAKHMVAKKNNIVRNAGIAAVAGAAVVAGSVVPANAFAMAAPVASSQTAPTLSTYSYGYTTDTVSYENTSYQAPAAGTSAGVTPQSNNTTPIAEATGSRAAVLAAAYDGLGGAYIWGGKSYKAWDCSGFVSYVYAQAGVSLTAYTYAMAAQLTPTSNPQPGDVVFTNGFAHVGIYVGNGQMISALNPSQGTQLTSVDGGGFMPVDGYYTAF